MGRLQEAKKRVEADRRAIEDVARTSRRLVTELPEVIRNIYSAIADFDKAISLNPAESNYEVLRKNESIESRAKAEEKVKEYEALLKKARERLEIAETFLTETEVSDARKEE